MGPILGAEFLVCVGDLCAFSSADRLAAYAGLVPAARDSGKRVGVSTAGCEEGTQDPKKGLLPVGVCQPACFTGVQSLLRAQAG
jgi:hypothetical protein